MTSKNINKPSINGRFGKFGGKFVPETLMSSLKEIEEAYEKYSKEKARELALNNDILLTPNSIFNEDNFKIQSTKKLSNKFLNAETAFFQDLK